MPKLRQHGGSQRQPELVIDVAGGERGVLDGQHPVAAAGEQSAGDGPRDLGADDQDIEGLRGRRGVDPGGHWAAEGVGARSA